MTLEVCTTYDSIKQPLLNGHIIELISKKQNLMIEH